MTGGGHPRVMNDEFYIGWETKAAPGIGRGMRRLMVVILAIVVLVPATLAVSQRLIGVSVFEWGRHKTFSGILRTAPCPCLLVPRPGNAGALPGFSTYYLVAPWKFGLNAAALAPFDGKPVTLQGTLIFRGTHTMIEAVPDSIRMVENVDSRHAPPRAPGAPSPPVGERVQVRGIPPAPVSLGRHSLVGEIVDSKCYLGVMNPGRLTPHRACAIRCISGGCPPVLVVRPKDGAAICLLLVSAEGKPVNQQVLDKVAEPLEITGEVERQGDLLILRADPATYRRVKQ